MPHTEPDRAGSLEGWPAVLDSNDQTAYHTAELRIATTPGDPRRIIPAIPSECCAILDVGCGAGQTLIACDLREGVLACGLDLDFSALRLGKEWAARVHFVQASGELIPFPHAQFDFVIARLSLPYLYIPAAVAEIHRVLKPGGKFWMVLHPFSMVWRQFLESVRALNFNEMLLRVYVLLNGVTVHLLGKPFRFPFNRRRCESFQTDRAMKRALRLAGFVRIQISRGSFYVATAEKPLTKSAL